MLAKASALTAAAVALQAHAYTVEPFTISLSSDFHRLKDQLTASRLPSVPIVGTDSGDFGISLATLETLQSEWLAFNWTAEEERLNSFVYLSIVISFL